MQSSEFTGKAKELVANRVSDNEQFPVENIHIVWYAWVLGSQKALLTTLGNNDGLYFEVTYNHARQEFYVDKYKKQNNELVPNWEV